MLELASTSRGIVIPNAPPQGAVGGANKASQHKHSHCTYVVGKSLVWEDLCPCEPN